MLRNLHPINAALVALLSSQLAACPEPPPEPEAVVRPVRFEVARLSQENAARTFSGVAHSGLESALSFRVAGNAREIAVQVGDNVAPGDLIARLDTSDYDVALQAASADSAAARARQRNAEADYERVRQLYETGAVSRSDLDAARAGFESTEAQLSATRQNVQRARDQVEYCRLTSPLGGQIAAVMVEVNENVQAGQPVVTLTSGAGEQLEVGVAIPETVIARVRQGMVVTVRFNALPGRTFEGAVTEVGVAPSGSATTFTVTVALAVTDPDVRSGMAADVTFRFESGDTQARVWLPAHAVTQDTDGTYLYLVEPSPGEPGFGVVHRREVVIGALDNRGLEVTSGVAEGERVVTAGVSRLSDGMRVRLPADEGDDPLERDGLEGPPSEVDTPMAPPEGSGEGGGE